MIKFQGQPQEIKGKMIFISAITAGNVPTYTLDHLICSNGFQRVAYLIS
jgi:hypothetical protein